MSGASNTIREIAELQVDCLYGKKKHFNAADRKQWIHRLLQIPAIVINVVLGSSLVRLLANHQLVPSPWFLALLSGTAAVLIALATFLNYPAQIQGNQRVANRYLALAKEAKRLLAYAHDGLLTPEQVRDRLESLAKRVEDLNQEAESYGTSSGDFQQARQGIHDGEELYTQTETQTSTD